MTEDPSTQFVDPSQPSVSGMTSSSIEIGQQQQQNNGINNKSDEENQSSAPTSAKSLNNNGSHYFPSSKQQQQQQLYQHQSTLSVSDSRRLNQTFTNGYASMRRATQPQPHHQSHQPPPAMLYRKEFLVPPEKDDPIDASVSWQMFSVELHRSPAVGFGIAISGGRDNPHFISGDPTIIISDVVPSGPAAGLVQLNDRIIIANGQNLENSDYATAVEIMKDAQQLNMIVKRRVPVPFIEFEQRTLKFTLSKSRKKDDFGIILGCKYYIKEITNPKLAEKDPGLKEGDVVLRVNGQSLDGVTLEEATRWLQRSREKLSLVVQRDVRRGTPGSRWSSQNTVYERLGSVSATPRHSPTPMHYTQSANPDMINTARKVSAEFGQNSKRYSDPMSRAFEYPPSSQHQQSLPPGYVPRSPQMGYVSNNMGNNPYCESPRLQNNMFPTNNLQRGGPPSQTPSVCSSPRMFGGPQRSDTRVVTFTKGRALGIRVIGGNQVGIFVSAVQDDSPAAMHGIKIGDRLLAVNAYSMERVTREQAVEYLLSVGDEVQLKVESAFEEFLTVRNNQLGDNFYIRPHFAYNPSNRRSGGIPPPLREVAFDEGDILRVTDTLFGGSVGQWKVQKLFSANATSDSKSNNEEIGVIPNLKKAEEISKESRMETSTLGRSLFRKKLQTKKTKSLTTQMEDELAAFDIPLPAYERVALKQPTFPRPIVLYGPLADVAKQLLLSNFALKFAGVGDESAKIISLSQIDAIIAAGKHAVMSVSPGSVERLHLAQYAPIVVMLDCDSRSRIRDLRSKSGATTNSARKLIEQTQKLKKHHGNLITATIDLQKEDHWFDTLKQTIFTLQDRRVWMPEMRPERPLHEMRLFPIQNLNNDSDADSLKGNDYGTTTGTSSATNLHQLEMRNQLYSTQTGTSSLDSGGIYSTKSDPLNRFQDEFSGINLNGNGTYGSGGGGGNRNPNFYSSLARSSPYLYSSNRSNYGSAAPSPYDPFINRSNGSQATSAGGGGYFDISKPISIGDYGSSTTSTIPNYDDTRSRLSASPYQIPIKHEDQQRTANIASTANSNARNLFFDNMAKNRGIPPPRESSRTPESAIDYRIAPISADERSTRTNYDPPFIDEPPSKSLNLDTLTDPSEDSSHRNQQNQIKEHVSGLVDWTGGTLTCPESGVELRIPENAISLGTEQHIYVEVCEEGGAPHNLPLSNKEALMSPLVVCGPQGLKFNCPVELRLPHKFTAGDPLGKNVVLKSGHGSQWTNIELVQPPRSDPTSKFVSVLVKHF